MLIHTQTSSVKSKRRLATRMHSSLETVKDNMLYRRSVARARCDHVDLVRSSTPTLTEPRVLCAALHRTRR